MTLRAHPYADKFPMLPDAEIEALADSIIANGLRNPIVLTRDGLILDGRNRAEACRRAGINAECVTYDGDDLAEYVIDCNTSRRHMSTGARAMSTALVLQADNRRVDGRWKRGSVVNPESGTSEGKAWQNNLNAAGVVLDFRPDLADAVVNGEMALDAAFRQADELRRSEQHSEVLERERKKRERDEAKAEAERNAQIVADLTDAESPFLADVESDRMTPAVAWAAHLEATRKEREAQAEVERGIRDTNVRLAEAVRSIAAHAPGDLLVDTFMPHHNRVVVEGMRLTVERCEDAITVLQSIVKELNR